MFLYNNDSFVFFLFFPDCPEDSQKEGPSCYIYWFNTLSWTEAQRKCQDKYGKTLASFADIHESQSKYVKSIIQLTSKVVKYKTGKNNYLI